MLGEKTMDSMTFCVPCLFGLEGLVGDELRRLDLQNVRVEDRLSILGVLLH